MKLKLFIAIGLIFLLCSSFCGCFDEDETADKNGEENNDKIDFPKKSDPLRINVTIKNGEFVSYSLLKYEAEEIVYNFTITNYDTSQKQAVKIYIMDKESLDNFPDGDWSAPFQSSVSDEIITGDYGMASGEWYLVLHNEVERGDVAISVYIDFYPWELVESLSDEIVIEKGNYFSLSLSDWSGDEVVYDFKVNASYSDESVSIYIMSEDDFNEFPDSDWSAPFMFQSTKEKSGNYHLASYCGWYLIIDNIEGNEDVKVSYSLDIYV